jgi:hypothetical protein
MGIDMEGERPIYVGRFVDRDLAPYHLVMKEDIDLEN